VKFFQGVEVDTTLRYVAVMCRLDCLTSLEIGFDGIRVRLRMIRRLYVVVFCCNMILRFLLGLILDAALRNVAKVSSLASGVGAARGGRKHSC